MRAMASAGYYVVSYDARGHGESDWSPDGDYSIDTLAMDLRAVLLRVPRRPALIGASLGGITSLIALGDSEEPIARALVLVDVAPTISSSGSARILAFMRSRPEGYATMEEVADAIAAYNPHRPRQKHLDGLAHNLRIVDGRFFWHWDPAFLDTRSYVPEVFKSRNEEAARRVLVPTLLVRGASSDLITQEHVDRFLKIIPAAEFSEVEGAGHMVAGDRNDSFNETVLGFLRRVDPVGLDEGG
jgi:pimeloyl-ACP methyl ester carboxylesterase